MYRLINLVLQQTALCTQRRNVADELPRRYQHCARYPEGPTAVCAELRHPAHITDTIPKECLAHKLQVVAQIGHVEVSFEHIPGKYCEVSSRVG